MALTRRQKQIFDFINEFIERNGYSPSLEEIGQHFGLSSVATVHKHVTNLVRKGLLRRSWNQNRSIEVVKDDEAPRAVEIPLMGRIVDGRPLESNEDRQALTVPSWLVGHGRTYALRVDGSALMHEHVCDGDFVVIEERRSAEDGQLVIALVHGEDAMVRKFYRDGAMTRLVAATGPAEPQILPPERVEVRGVVRGVLRKC